MINKFLIIGVFLILLCPLIIADLGLSSDYHRENPILVDLGYDNEMVIGRFINNGNESLNLKVELVEGFEIAEIVNDNVVVSANSKEELKVRVIVPKNASLGGNYSIGIKYTETGSGGEGMIVISTSNTVRVPIFIREIETISGESEEKGISKNIIWIILGILVLIVVVVVIKFVLKEKQTFPETVGEV